MTAPIAAPDGRSLPHLLVSVLIDEGTVLLQIEEDGTFTVAMRPTGAANNVAKASSWSGTVSQSGARVVFHVAKGSWPAWSSLAAPEKDSSRSSEALTESPPTSPSSPASRAPG